MACTAPWLLLVWTSADDNAHACSGSGCRQWVLIVSPLSPSLAFHQAGQTGAKTLQLHGLWPDFSSLYNSYGTPALPLPSSLAGAYQGWPQYCSPAPGSSSSQDGSKCHTSGPYNTFGCTVTSQVGTHAKSCSCQEGPLGGTFALPSNRKPHTLHPSPLLHFQQALHPTPEPHTLLLGQLSPIF